MSARAEIGEFMKIVLFSVFAAVAYGIIHDQVTAHLCVEYFTIAHPPVFPTQSPFWLALGWGPIATWWVGLPLGLALALVARMGRGRRFSLADVRPSILRLLIFMGSCAVIAGATGAFLVATNRIGVPGGWAELIPVQKHVAFTADAYAHLASYASGVAGGLSVIGYWLYRRVVPHL